MNEFEQDVIERLTRIEAHIETHLEADKDIHEDQESRIRVVEGHQKVTNGLMVLLAPVLAFLGYHVTLH